MTEVAHLKTWGHCHAFGLRWLRYAARVSTSTLTRADALDRRPAPRHAWTLSSMDEPLMRMTSLEGQRTEGWMDRWRDPPCLRYLLFLHATHPRRVPPLQFAVLGNVFYLRTSGSSVYLGPGVTGTALAYYRDDIVEPDEPKPRSTSAGLDTGAHRSGSRRAGLTPRLDQFSSSVFRSRLWEPLPSRGEGEEGVEGCSADDGRSSRDIRTHSRPWVVCLSVYRLPSVYLARGLAGSTAASYARDIVILGNEVGGCSVFEAAELNLRSTSAARPLALRFLTHSLLTARRSDCQTVCLSTTLFPSSERRAGPSLARPLWLVVLGSRGTGSSLGLNQFCNLFFKFDLHGIVQCQAGAVCFVLSTSGSVEGRRNQDAQSWLIRHHLQSRSHRVGWSRDTDETGVRR
ncbi:hypothetical protein DFP72DRAFT_849986 [Ephemerocybe angulata]|uniref:Uncharacterized protein n=1 Tax=Ephemerocybe angulata TaxID=980116 RepID=A0A8H6HVB0_9AGAR|nr:hypothetical protein DFP72DRAFT_849986 [Tulosesus angulatus]